MLSSPYFHGAELPEQAQGFALVYSTNATVGPTRDIFRDSEASILQRSNSEYSRLADSSLRHPAAVTADRCYGTRLLVEGFTLSAFLQPNWEY